MNHQQLDYHEWKCTLRRMFPHLHVVSVLAGVLLGSLGAGPGQGRVVTQLRSAATGGGGGIVLHICHQDAGQDGRII